MASVELIPSPVNGYYHPGDQGEPGTQQRRLSVNDNEARILAELVRGLSVLEIGTGLGVAMRAMAKTAQHVITVDIDPWVAQTLGDLPENVTFYNTLPSGVNFDAAFIDGSHAYEAVMKDIKACQYQVKPGGLLIFHDLYIDPVRQAILDSGLKPLHIQTRAGMAVCWNE